MKTLVLVLLFNTACFANGQSTTVAPSVAGSTSVAMGSTTAISAGSTSMTPPQSTSQVASSSAMTPQSSSSQVMSSSPSPSASSSPSVSPSQSMSSSASMSPSASMSSSASMSPSMSVSPSASSSAAPASSRVPTTNPPTTNPTTTAPKPHYDVDVKVLDEKNHAKPCLWFKATINVTYNHENVSGQISLNGKGAKTTGTCSDFTNSSDTSEVTLSWTNEKITSMTAQFSAGSKDNWYFSKIGVVLNIPDSSNGQVIAEKTFKEDENTEYLHASLNKSYSCAIPEKLTLDSKQANVTMKIIDIMVQPFTNNNTLVNHKDTDSCSSKSKSSKSSSIVPIAVGCALAGLIVIVLIAYLIGRRKNDGRGYQQV